MICKFIKNLFGRKKEINLKYTFKPNIETEWQSEEEKLLAKVNQYRVDNKLSQLTPEEEFYRVASNRNNTMVENGEISHDWFYNEVEDVLQVSGVTKVSENLGYGFTYPGNVFNAWKKSEDHSSNLLDPRWKYTGIAIDVDKDGEKFYCQIFGY